ncbi:MAG: hypothetical protein HRT88_20000 [Lentisphaeraceae bacterium]|nr:hypothetical protein [Lentisphaeraceae bacterium]
MKNEYQEEPQKKSLSFAKILLYGCLTFILIAAAGVYWLTQNYKGLMAGGTGMLINVMVQETPLPKQEQKEIMQPINDFIQQYKDGKISDEEAKAVLTNLGAGAVFQTVALRLFEAVYIERSSLQNDAKQEAKITLSRYRKAFIDGAFKAHEGELDTINDIITHNEQSGTSEEYNFKDSLTEEELARCLTIMNRYANEAKITQQYFEVRLGELIQKAIDTARLEARGKGITNQ